MELPNGDRAVVELAKLQEYCLNRSHARGRHKARVFASILGLTAEDAPILREALLASARENDATLGEEDAFGRRYVVDFPMRGPKGKAMVRGIWIVMEADDPRLVTCFLL